MVLYLISGATFSLFSVLPPLWSVVGSSNALQENRQGLWWKRKGKKNRMWKREEGELEFSFQRRKEYATQKQRQQSRCQGQHRHIWVTRINQLWDHTAHREFLSSSRKCLFNDRLKKTKLRCKFPSLVLFLLHFKMQWKKEFKKNAKKERPKENTLIYRRRGL